MQTRALQWDTTSTNHRHSTSRRKVVLQRVLPKAPGGEEALPEGLLWLMLTGEVPTQAQVQGLSRDLEARSELPQHVLSVLKALPKGTHPMTQLSIGIMALQPDSKFAKAYQAGLHRPPQLQHAQRMSLWMRNASTGEPGDCMIVSVLQ